MTLHRDIRIINYQLFVNSEFQRTATIQYSSTAVPAVITSDRARLDEVKLSRVVVRGLSGLGVFLLQLSVSVAISSCNDNIDMCCLQVRRGRSRVPRSI